MTNEEIVNEAREVKEMNWRREKSEVLLTTGLIQSLAQCQAMIEMLADNRMLAMEIFKSMPAECRERFEECIKRVSKYLDDLED